MPDQVHQPSAAADPNSHIPMTRRQKIELLNGLRRGTRSITDVFYNWPVKTFYVYTSVPGYVENEKWIPIPETVLVEAMETYPRVRVVTMDATGEESLIRMKRKAREGNYPHLRQWIPAAFIAECQEEAAKQKKEEAEAREQHREKEAFDAWVRETQPEEYERDGYTWRKRMMPFCDTPGYERLEPSCTGKSDWLEEKEKDLAEARSETKELHAGNTTAPAEVRDVMPAAPFPPNPAPVRRYCIL
jgi:hypothetical protein